MAYSKEIFRVPEYRKQNILDVISFKVYNFFRRPIVKRKQVELKSIFDVVYCAIKKEFLPAIYPNIKDCESCRNVYGSFENQIFLSQIQLILRTMECQEHFQPYVQFLLRYRHEFKRSEQISSWINGFSK
jgi:hypothetical protein